MPARVGGGVSQFGLCPPAARLECAASPLARWKRAASGAQRSRAERPGAMGSPALLPLLLLFLPFVQPSHGFPGRVGGGVASPEGRWGPREVLGDALCWRKSCLWPPQGASGVQRDSRLGTRESRPLAGGSGAPRQEPASPSGAADPGSPSNPGWRWRQVKFGRGLGSHPHFCLFHWLKAAGTPLPRSSLPLKVPGHLPHPGCRARATTVTLVWSALAEPLLSPTPWRFRESLRLWERAAL